MARPPRNGIRSGCATPSTKGRSAAATRSRCGATARRRRSRSSSRNCSSGMKPGLVLCAAVLLGVAATSAGCDRRIHLPLVANQRPTLTLSQARAGGGNRYFYAYEMCWSGYDADGRVDYYEYSVDPPGAANAETSWLRTLENRTV